MREGHPPRSGPRLPRRGAEPRLGRGGDKWSIGKPHPEEQEEQEQEEEEEPTTTTRTSNAGADGRLFIPDRYANGGVMGHEWATLGAHFFHPGPRKINGRLREKKKLLAQETSFDF